MIEKDDLQLEVELAEALGADDAVAALERLAGRWAYDARAVERIGAARRLVVELAEMSERLAAEPVPAMAKLNLPARRVRPRWIAIPAAAAVAAAVIAAAALLWPQKTVESPALVEIATSQPPQPGLVWRVPSVAPISLPDGTLAVPEVSIPSTSSMGIGWSVPSITFEYSERSNGDET